MEDARRSRARARGKRRSQQGPLVRRLQQELKDVQDEEYENISVSALDDDIREWNCLVNGPPDSPYEDGIWKLKIIIGQNWPHHAPRVGLKTKILHVNHQKRLCLSVLDNWDSRYHLAQIPLQFYNLLKEPDFDDPLNTQLNDLRDQNEQEYLRQVRKHTNTYAKKIIGDNSHTDDADNGDVTLRTQTQQAVKVDDVTIYDRVTLNTGQVGKIVFIGDVDDDNREMSGTALDEMSLNGHAGSVDGKVYFNQNRDLFIKYFQNKQDIEYLFENCCLETNIWQNSKYSDLCKGFQSDGRDLSIMEMIFLEENKMNTLTKRCKKGVQTIWNSFRRSMSFLDLFTDVRLLYLLSIADDPIISFVILLSVSLVCPYIVSYSCGIKLFHINRDNNYDIKNFTQTNSFDGYVALKKIIAYLSLSPIGVFYFLLLDLIDIIFVYYKLFSIIFFGKNEMEMKLLEEMVSKQLGMSRMDYEGIKRQRATAQLSLAIFFCFALLVLCFVCFCLFFVVAVFETIPQAVLQVLLLRNVSDGSSVEASDVYLSIVSAILNCMFQILRLRLESQACKEKFSDYCLECLMARISWIPFEKRILKFLNRNNSTIDTKVTVITLPNTSDAISYDMTYEYPCGISKRVGYTPKLEFDFSSLTIQKLISTIKVSKTITATATARNPLKINFGKSLRLINFQDLMNLFEACFEKDIKIIGFNNASIAHLLTNAINISANAAKDVRLLSNCRNSFGKPFVSNLFSLAKVFGTSSQTQHDGLLATMFECFISNDFDVNVNDKRSGETIIFDLIRYNRHKEFVLLLQKFVKEKQSSLMLNYYNYSGVSPLYFAIKQHIQQLRNLRSKSNERKENEFKSDEKNEKEDSNDDIDNHNGNNGDNDTDNVLSMYEILIENEWEVASVNFPAFERNGIVRSCLASALLANEWDIVNKLLTKGAVLNVTEISVLIEVYLDLAYDNVNDTGYAFDTLKKLLNQCHICNKHLMDEYGNNPIHKIFKNIREDTIDDVNGITLKQHINGIDKLLTICNEWMLMENNDNKLPIEYLFNLMFPQRRKIVVDYQQIQLCTALMHLIQEKFGEIYLKLTTHRIKEYPICVSYLRLLLLFGCTSQEEENETYVSLAAHFGDIIFDEKIEGAKIASKRKDLKLGVKSKYANWVLNKFVATNFSEKKISFDFLIKCLVTSDDIDVSSKLDNIGSGYVITVSQVSQVSQTSQTLQALQPDPNLLNDSSDDNKNEFKENTNEDEDEDDDDTEKEKFGGQSDIAQQDETEKTETDDETETEKEDEKEDEKDETENENEDKKEEEREDSLQNVEEGEQETSVLQEDIEREPLTWIELVYILCVESLSCADLVTDYIILDQLMDDHVWWSTFSVIFMISPYLVSYTAMGSMLKKKSNRLSLIVMTPLCLVYFMILDVVFMIYALFSSCIFLFSFGDIDIGDWMETHFFYTTLGISRMELYGYRRLRTIAQLLFETFPSLILQVRILSVIGIDSKLGVSPEALMVSIFFAILHMFMEGMIIKLDSLACHLSMYEYCIVCINARLSWIPYANILTMKSMNKNNNGIQHTNKNISTKMSAISQFTSLNFEEIVSKFLCLHYKLDFQFGKDSWQILMTYINNIVEFAPNGNNSISIINENLDREKSVELELIGAKELLAPILTDIVDDRTLTNKERSLLFDQNETFSAMPRIMKLTFGEKCCKNIDLFDLFRLYQVGSNKVIVDCETIDWQGMIRRTRTLRGKSQMVRVLDNLNHVFCSVGDYVSAIELDKHRKQMGYYDTVGNIDIDDEDKANDSWIGLLKERLHKNDSFVSLKETLLENVRFNMYPLKQSCKNGVMYGINCNESKKLYLTVYQLLQLPLASVDTIMITIASDDETHAVMTNASYASVFENGQYFYTAMLVLFFTQGTIFEQNHHCYECGNDWIDHLQQCDDNFKNNFRDSSSNNNIDSTFSSSSGSIRDKMTQLFAAYIPNDIKIKQKGNKVYNDVPIEAVTICEPFKKAFGEYLFKRAYFYSLAIGAASNGVNLPILSELLSQLKENTSFKITLNDKKSIDPTINQEQLDLLAQFSKASINSATIESPCGVLDGLSSETAQVKLICFDKKHDKEHAQEEKTRVMSFYGELENKDNIFVARIDASVSFDILTDNINIWDNDIMCKTQCYLYCENATKIPLDKSIDINASDIINTENGDKIKMSWNVNHIYNIQNSINIGTASIEIKFTFLDSFIQEFGVKREMIDSIDCQVVYQDIKAIDRYLIFDV